ncbi:MAG: RrF2 family transcriptional regulator [Aminivibrio sp.]|jgi:Rrf2 family protein
MSGIMAVSEAVSLAMHGMGLLASGGRMSAKKIAETVHVSEGHLAKVLQKLTKEGLVTSARGPGGGFKLARPASDISLYDIYRVIEGVPDKDLCLIRHETCPFTECIFGSLLGDLTLQFLDYLKNTALSEIKRGET